MKKISLLLAFAFVTFLGTAAQAASFTATVSSFKVDDSRKGPSGAAGRCISPGTPSITSSTRSALRYGGGTLASGEWATLRCNGR